MPHERRRYPRVRVDLPVEIAVAGGDSFSGRTHDMSVGGAFILAEPSPAIATKLSLTLQLPSGKPLAVDATVRWTKPDGIGVQFGLMGVRETYALSELLSDLEPMPDSRRPPAGG